MKRAKILVIDDDPADLRLVQKILDELREELAHHYLSATDYTSAEISFLLGYEEPNSFFRAFHAWTGQTPEIIRVNRQSNFLQNVTFSSNGQ